MLDCKQKKEKKKKRHFCGTDRKIMVSHDKSSRTYFF